MKYLILFFGILFSLSIHSQEYKDCSYTYFKNSKKTSTSHCYSENKSEGKAVAYNLKGEKIGEWNLSRMHMLSSVHFSFHENGGISKAEYSSHPDAGIQWYKSYTTYDENGVKTGFTEMSDDMRTTIEVEPTKVKSREEYQKEQKQKADKLLKEADSLFKLSNEKKNEQTLKQVQSDSLKQEVVESSVIYVSELWLENKTGKDIMLKWDKKYKGDAKENSPSFEKVKKGEKIKITEIIQAQFYESPITSVNISIWNSKGKKKLSNKISNIPLVDESRENENRKGFVYEIR